MTLGSNFDTIRVVSWSLMIEVLKRNGSTQNWDKHKMISSMTKAGLSEIEAGLIASLIKENFLTSGKQTVKSSELRKTIVGILKAVGSRAADVYKYFSKDASG